MATYVDIFSRRSGTINWSLFVLALLALYLTSHVNYLLFHGLVELFSIVVATAVFMIAWNSKDYIKNPYVLFIGIAYLFIGFIDLMHTLTYKGMNIITGYEFYANQLWIGARFIESSSLLLGFLFLHRHKQVNPYNILAGYSIFTTLLLLSIFYWKIFPECFVEGVGLTPFKKNSEYVICAILLSAVYLLVKNKSSFYDKIYKLVLWSLLCTIVSELAFTFYISNYGLSNLVGHYFKLFSFCLIYLAIIDTCLKRPYELIFKELDESNKQLNEEVEARKKTEAELRGALEEIKTLRGIIPICAHCKKIRDDGGYWQQLENYISKHSEAEFSHGICPECIKKLYPEFADDLPSQKKA